MAALEARLGLILPDDFRAYLLVAAPEAVADDRNDICWWPVDAIRPVPEELAGRPNAAAVAKALGGEPEKYLFFADYMGWAYAWAICCSHRPERGKVVLICVGLEGVVADSFAMFAALAMRNSPDIHLSEVGPHQAPPIARSPPPPARRRLSFLELLIYLPLVVLVSGAAAAAAIWAANHLR